MNPSSHAFYTGATPSVTVASSVTLLIAIVESSTTSGNVELDGGTLGAQGGVFGGSTVYNRASIGVVAFPNPAAGVATFTPSFVVAPNLGYTVEVYEFTDAGAEALANVVTFTAGSTASSFSKDITVTNLAGKTYIAAGVSYDDNTINATSGTGSANFSAVYTTNDATRQVISGYVDSVADASEVYSLIFNDDNMAGGSVNGFAWLGFTVDLDPTFSVDSIDNSTPVPADDIVITVSNKGGTVTAGDFTVVSQTSTTVTVTVPDPTLFILTGQTYPTLTFESNTTITLDDTVTTADAVIQIQTPAGTEYGEITALDGDGMYGNDPSAANGMFAYVYDLVGSPVIDIATGLYALASGESFKYKLYNGEWGGAATVSEPEAAPGQDTGTPGNPKMSVSLSISL